MFKKPGDGFIPEFEEEDDVNEMDELGWSIEKRNPFKRSSKISRSPTKEETVPSPMQPRTPTLPLPRERNSFRKAMSNCITLGKQMEDSKKRPRESPENRSDKEQKKVCHVTEKMDVQKKGDFWEIFELIVRSTKQLNLIKTEDTVIKETTEELLKLVESAKALVEETKNTSVKTAKKKREDVIKEKIDNGIKDEEMDELLKQFWPEATFRRTEWIKEEPKVYLKEKFETVAFIVDMDEKTEREIEKGQVLLTKTRASILNEGDDLIKMKACSSITLKVDSSNNEDLCNELKKGLKIICNMECDNFATTNPKIAKLLRKLLEIEANRGDFNYKLFCKPSEKKREETDRKNEKWPTIKPRKIPSLIVKPAEGQTFADTLKKMKETVKNTHGVTVKNITNKNGDVKINLKTFNNKKVESFRKEIEEKMGVVTEKIERTKEIIVRDLDETTEPIEILSSIQKEANYTLKEKIIVSKNVNRFGLKYAIIRVPDQIAKLLISKKRIRVGLGLICRVEEYIVPLKCYRCQGFGHLGKDCKAEATKMKKDGCFRCSKEGHIAKQCPNPARCYECNEEGHRADSMMCPKYRSIAQQMRKEKRRTLKNSSNTNNGSS